MADAKVEIQISAKDNASAVFSKIGSSAANLGKSMAVGIAAGGAAVAAGIGAAVKVAADFEKQMSAVQAVSGATGEEMAQLSGKALQLGKDTSFSASEAAAGLEELVKGGIPIGDIMNGAAEATLALAEAGGVDLKTAAEIAAAAINTFNLSGQDMGHVADLIAGAANNSAIDVNDFRLSTAAAGAAVALAGGSFDDMAVAITAMGQAGIKGSDAGTSLKTMLLNLQPRTKEQVKLFDELGITTRGASNQFFDAQGKMRSFADVAGVLQTALKGQTDQQKLSTLETIFGSDAIRAASVFAEQGSEGFTTLGEAIGRQGSAAEAGRIRLDNLSGDVEKLGGSVEVAAIRLGQAFQPAMRAAVQALDGFVNDTLVPFAEAVGPPLAAAAIAAGTELGKIGESAKTAVSEGLNALGVKIDEIGAQWAPWAAQAGPAGEAVGLALAGVHGVAMALELFLRGDFQGGMKVGEDAMGNFGGAADAAKRAVDELRVEVEKLSATRTILSEFSLVAESLGRSFGNLRAVVPPLLGDIFNLGKEAGIAGEQFDLWGGAVRLATAPLLALVGTIERVTGAAKNANDIIRNMGPTLDELGTRASGLATEFTNALDTLKANAAAAMAGVTQAIVDELARMAETGSTRIQGFVSRVTSQLEEMSSGAQAALQGFVEVVGTSIEQAAEAAGTAINGMVTNALAQLDAMTGGAATAMGSFVESISTGLANANAAVLAWAGEFVNSVVTAVSSAAGGAYSAAVGIGSSIVSGLVSGIQAVAGNVASAAAATVTNALNAARAAISAQSPSLAFAELGEDAVAGLVVGLEEATPEAEQVAAELGEAALDATALAIETAIDEVAPQIQETAIDLGESVGEAIAAGLGNTKTLAAGVDALKGTVAGAMQDLAAEVDKLNAQTEQKFTEIGDKTIAALTNAVSAAAEQLADIIADTADQIADLEANLARGRDQRSARDRFAGGQDAEARARAARREGEDLARDRAKEDADWQRELSRDLQKAKTVDEKAAIIARAQEARDEMLRRRAEEDDDRAYAKRREQEDRDFAKQQAQKAREFEDQQEQDALNRAIMRAVQERDARVAELTKTLDEKQKKIDADHQTEMAKFVQASQNRIAVLRDEFLAKLPSLTNGAAAIVGNFTDRINLMLQRTARLAQDAARAIASIGNLPEHHDDEHIPEFAHGGVVPGARGEPTLALVHGGEQILPSGAGVGGGGGYAGAQTGVPSTVINLSVYGTVLTPTDLVDAIHNGLLAKKRGLGTLGLA